MKNDKIFSTLPLGTREHAQKAWPVNIRSYDLHHGNKKWTMKHCMRSLNSSMTLIKCIKLLHIFNS